MTRRHHGRLAAGLLDRDVLVGAREARGDGIEVTPLDDERVSQEHPARGVGDRRQLDRQRGLPVDHPLPPATEDGLMPAFVEALDPKRRGLLDPVGAKQEADVTPPAAAVQDPGPEQDRGDPGRGQDRTREDRPDALGDAADERPEPGEERAAALRDLPGVGSRRLSASPAAVRLRACEVQSLHTREPPLPLQLVRTLSDLPALDHFANTAAELVAERP